MDISLKKGMQITSNNQTFFFGWVALPNLLQFF